MKKLLLAAAIVAGSCSLVMAQGGGGTSGAGGGGTSADPALQKQGAGTMSSRTGAKPMMTNKKVKMKKKIKRK